MRKTDYGIQLRVLHILTLNTKSGEYGGPIKVARESCLALNQLGFTTEIISGTRSNSHPEVIPTLCESFIDVYPVSQKYPISSLWSMRLCLRLIRKIRKFDVVHIHLARDLIPILAALICRILRIKYVVQTHGMVVSDGRLITSIIDKLFIAPILNSSSRNFALTQDELSRLSTISKCVKFEILGNGISLPETNLQSNQEEITKVVFCSRLHPQKGLDKFLALADYFKGTDIVFMVYGPDGGDLPTLHNYLKSEERNSMVQYGGALQPREVTRVISEYDLLILPSYRENFPMVVLEALSVGVPTLVMKSCGISNLIEELNELLVCRDESSAGLIETFTRLQAAYPFIDRKSVVEFCEGHFSIKNVALSLGNTYMHILEHDEHR
jgi:glycosyltransferase involved in cell wall biosynthesis